MLTKLFKNTMFQINRTIHAHSLMFNTVFEANFWSWSCIRPYVGGGIGLVYFDGDLTTDNPLPTSIEIDDPKLGWQGIVGVNLAITQSIDLFGEYRLMQTSEIDIENSDTGAILGTADPEFDTYLVGIRFYR